jgi:hypothetical protein
MVFARCCSSTFQSGCTGVVLQHDPGRWICRYPEAPVSWPPRSLNFNPIHFYLWGSVKIAVYANFVVTREELWQRIQDVANEICTTPGAFERVRASFQHRADVMCSCPWKALRAFVLAYVTSKAFRISEIMECKTNELLYSVTFYRNISGPVYIRIFYSY